MGAIKRAARSEHATLFARGVVECLLLGHAAASEDSSLYHGQAGVLLALKAPEQVGDEHRARAVADGADPLATRVDSLEDCSLHFGLAGIAGALRLLGRDERRIAH